MERPPGNVLVILRQNVRLVSQLMIQAFAFWSLIKNTIIEQKIPKKGLETTMNTFTGLQRTEIRTQFDKKGTFENLL